MLALDDYQRLYQEAVEKFFSTLPEEDQIRSLIAGDHPPCAGEVSRIWSRLVRELKAPALPIAEDLCGEGAGWQEAGIVMRAIGSNLAAVPYLSVMAAARLLQGIDDAGAAEALCEIAAHGRTYVVAIEASFMAEAMEAAALHYGDGKVGGYVGAVLDAQYAQTFICPVATADGLGIALVDRADVQVVPVQMLDLTRSLSSLHFKDAPGRLIKPSDAEGSLTDLAAFAAAALAMESIGGAERCIADTVNYAKLRVQFGKQIGSYQAVKHALADLLRLVGPAKAAAYAALDAATNNRGNLPLAAAVAKLSAVEAYVAAAGTAIQLHGAIGFTWEVTLQLHFKRAIAARTLVGSTAKHRAVLAQAMLAEANAYSFGWDGM